MAYQISLSFNETIVSNQFESFSFTESVAVIEQTVSGKGGQTIRHVPGAEHVTSLTLTRQVDSASPTFQRLFQSIQAGKNVKQTATLAFTDAAGTEFLEYSFSNAFVSGIATSGNRHGGTAPEEQIQITFDEVTLVTT